MILIIGGKGQKSAYHWLFYEFQVSIRLYIHNMCPLFIDYPITSIEVKLRLWYI